jgi:hypothetical protein
VAGDSRLAGMSEGFVTKELFTKDNSELIKFTAELRRIKYDIVNTLLPFTSKVYLCQHNKIRLENLTLKYDRILTLFILLELQ